MKVFTVRIEQRRVRRRRIVAATEEEARRAAGLILRGSDRVLSATIDAGPLRECGDPAEARQALAHLMGCPFLELDGHPAKVRQWLDLVRFAPDRRELLNRTLALAGLRLREDMSLCVASPGSIPTMNEWFGRTKWPGAQLLTTLDAIPGSARLALTFAGLPARAVVLPASEIFEGMADA